LSWGFAWDASRAGGLHGSLQTKKKVLKTSKNATPEALKSLPNRFKMAPGGLPEPPQERKRKWSPFLLLFLASWAALGVLLGRFWRAAPGAVFAPPGRRFGFPGASFGSSLGLFFRRLWKNTKFFKTLVFSMVFDGFGVPGGSKIDPRWLPKSLLGASWRLLALSWRLSALSLASLAGLLALLGPLGRLLGRSWGDFKLQDKTWLSWNGKRVQSESCKHGKKGKSSESSKNRESQSASTMRSSTARAARPARASKRQSNMIAYALAQPLRGLAWRGAHCSAAKASRAR